MDLKWLWSEASDLIGLTDAQPSYTVIGNAAVVVEGQKSLLKLSGGEVSFIFNKKVLIISGNNLRLKKLSKGFAVVAGEIERVECS